MERRFYPVDIKCSHCQAYGGNIDFLISDSNAILIIFNCSDCKEPTLFHYTLEDIVMTALLHRITADKTN